MALIAEYESGHVVLSEVEEVCGLLAASISFPDRLDTTVCVYHCGRVIPHPACSEPSYGEVDRNRGDISLQPDAKPPVDDALFLEAFTCHGIYQQHRDLPLGADDADSLWC